MSSDPFDIVRHSIAALNDHNALLAAQARLKRLQAEGERMERILRDLEDVETNAVTKAVIREALRRWQEANADGR